MDIISFLSEAPCTPFAPEWNWVIAEEMLTNVDFNKIVQELEYKFSSLK